MSRFTENIGLPAPTDPDPAAMALQLESLAVRGDYMIEDEGFTNWAAFTGWQPSSTENATPGFLRTISGVQGAWAANTERFVSWDATIFNNTSAVIPTGDMVLPDQDQRYWWWVGANLRWNQSTAYTRAKNVFYVNDVDPVTGQLAFAAHRANAYAIGNGNEHVLVDAFVRSGGGRIRLGVTWGVGSMNLQTGSFMWAIRKVPDRW